MDEYTLEDIEEALDVLIVAGVIEAACPICGSQVHLHEDRCVFCTWPIDQEDVRYRTVEKYPALGEPQ